MSYASDLTDNKKNCGCSCSTAAAFSSYDALLRQKRACVRGCGCTLYDISGIIAVTTAGTTYFAGNYVQLVGGTPVDQPALFRVTGPTGATGPLTGITLLTGGSYKVKPVAPTALTSITGSGAGATVTVTWKETKSCC